MRGSSGYCEFGILPFTEVLKPMFKRTAFLCSTPLLAFVFLLSGLGYAQQAAAQGRLHFVVPLEIDSPFVLVVERPGGSRTEFTLGDTLSRNRIDSLVMVLNSTPCPIPPDHQWQAAAGEFSTLLIQPALAYGRRECAHCKDFVVHLPADRSAWEDIVWEALPTRPMTDMPYTWLEWNPTVLAGHFFMSFAGGSQDSLATDPAFLKPSTATECGRPEMVRQLFFDFLDRGQQPAQALRAAQLRLMMQPGYESPGRWATQRIRFAELPE